MLRPGDEIVHRGAGLWSGGGPFVLLGRGRHGRAVTIKKKLPRNTRGKKGQGAHGWKA